MGPPAYSPYPNNNCTALFDSEVQNFQMDPTQRIEQEIAHNSYTWDHSGN